MLDLSTDKQACTGQVAVQELGGVLVDLLALLDQALELVVVEAAGVGSLGLGQNTLVGIYLR